MKKKVIGISIAFGVIIVMIVLSNIIIVVEKIGQITHSGIYGEFVIYVLLFLLIYIYLIRPIRKVYKTPQIPSMQTDDSMDIGTLRRIGVNLASGFDYIPDKEIRNRQQGEFKYKLNHSHDIKSMKACIDEEVQIRLQGNSEWKVEGIDNYIKEKAKTVFMVTALSHNSKIDAISALVLNFSMMKDMILATGFRPNNVQMWQMYMRILITSLFSYVVSELLAGTGSKSFDFLDNANVSNTGDAVDADFDVAPEVDTDSFSLPNILGHLTLPIIGPILDGISNALLTLRIGYITRSYLLEGQDLFSSEQRERRKEVRKEALANSLKALPEVLIEGSKGMSEKVQNFITSYSTKLYPTPK